MGMGGQRRGSVALLPGKNRYPVHRRLAGRLGRSGRVQNISPPTGLRSPDRPVLSDCAIRAHTVSPCSVPIFEFVLFGCYSSLIVDSPVMLTVGRNQEDVIDKTVCELRAKISRYLGEL